MPNLKNKIGVLKQKTIFRVFEETGKCLNSARTNGLTAELALLSSILLHTIILVVELKLRYLTRMYCIVQPLTIGH